MNGKFSLAALCRDLESFELILSWSRLHSAGKRILFISQIIFLTNFNAVVAQNRVGSDDVKINIRQSVVEQIRQADEVTFFVALGVGDFELFFAVDLFGFNSVQKIDSFLNACFEFRKTFFFIWMRRNFDLCKSCCPSFGRVASDLYLAH